jgi:DNA repair protein SbcD/Mre11
MKILHTSDWHLGRSLYSRNRKDEFVQFLKWLVEIIQKEKIEALLVAGDVFDTGTPPNWAQELYYKFLYEVSQTSCKHVVIIAGNHDSPTFLDAPKSLLKILNVHVVGAVTESIEDEVIVLKDTKDNPQLIVCAVPYLRDRDIRISETGETIEDKKQKLLHGIKEHYSKVLEIAKQKAKIDNVPIVTMGHLFTAGGQTTNDDGVRELYVGSLVHVHAEMFDSEVAYIALGHLHIPQKVINNEFIRYSGSPIPMGFGESKQKKKVLSIEIQNNKTIVTEIEVPLFQHIVRIAGGLDYIISQVDLTKKETPNAWIEIEYSGKEILGNLRETIESLVAGSTLDVLRIKSNSLLELSLMGIEEQETLENLSTYDVFERCLLDYKVPEEQKISLLQSFNEIIYDINESGKMNEN